MSKNEKLSSILAAMNWKCGGYGVSVSDWEIAYPDPKTDQTIKIRCSSGVASLFSLLGILTTQLNLPVEFCAEPRNNGIEQKMWDRFVANEKDICRDEDQDLVTAYSYYTCF